MRKGRQEIQELPVDINKYPDYLSHPLTTIIIHPLFAVWCPFWQDPIHYINSIMSPLTATTAAVDFIPIATSVVGSFAQYPANHSIDIMVLPKTVLHIVILWHFIRSPLFDDFWFISITIYPLLRLMMEEWMKGSNRIPHVPVFVPHKLTTSRFLFS